MASAAKGLVSAQIPIPQQIRAKPGRQIFSAFLGEIEDSDNDGFE